MSGKITTLDQITNEQIAYQEERIALVDRVKSLTRAIELVKRKRSMRDSERAMALATYSRDLLALNRILRKHYPSVN